MASEDPANREPARWMQRSSEQIRGLRAGSTMLNPYQSPTAPTARSFAGFRYGRIVFFAINSAVALLLVVSGLVALIEPPNGYTLVGAVMILPLPSLYLVGEFLAFFSGDHIVEENLGCVNLAAAALVAFGLVGNLGEALTDGGRPDFQVLFWFLLIGSSIIAYLAGCGWYRVKHTRVDRRARWSACLMAARRAKDDDVDELPVEVTIVR